MSRAPYKIIRVVLVYVLIVATLFVLPKPAAAVSNPEASFCSEDAKTIVRLYRAYFNRTPDAKGLAYWGGVYSDSDLHNVAYWMSQSPEFQKKWENVSPRSYVSKSLYNNLLRRPHDNDGLDYWEDDVTKVGRDQIALYWVQTPELKKKHPVDLPSGCSDVGFEKFQFRNIRGGQVVDVDYKKVDIKTSRSRCSVASINANWLYLSNNQPINIAIVDGVVLNSVDRGDRGVIGERYSDNSPRPAGEIDDWSGDVFTDYIFQKPGLSLEHEHNFYDSNINGWRWAASGISLITGGDVSDHLSHINTSDYTHGTRGHSFVATKEPGIVTFGSTTDMNAWELVAWAQSEGYTNLVKMDGGGSVEFNTYGTVKVAGTGRAIPVWLGIGC